MTNQEAINILRHYVSNKEHYEATERAIDALEKQIPIKAIEPPAYALPGTKLCPVCGDLMIERKYCDNCGQAIDWGVKNEKD